MKLEAIETLRLRADDHVELRRGHRLWLYKQISSTNLDSHSRDDDKKKKKGLTLKL